MGATLEAGDARYQAFLRAKREAWARIFAEIEGRKRDGVARATLYQRENFGPDARPFSAAEARARAAAFRQLGLVIA